MTIFSIFLLQKNTKMRHKNCFNSVIIGVLTFFLLLSSSSFSQNFNQGLNQEIETKINELISKMSLEDKIGQTCQITLDALLKSDDKGATLYPHQIDADKLNEAIEKYKIGSVLNVSSHTLSLQEWKSLLPIIHKSYLKGNSLLPILYGIDAIHGMNYTIGGTLFPQEIGLAATWNRSFAKRFGEITAYEMKASGIPWNFSPVLDVARQPLWSRYFETLGEDPFLAMSMGKELINGYQGTGAMDEYHGAACLKHFVGYSQPLSGRDRTPAWIPEKYMQELFLPPFKEAVEAGAMTLMINSGDVNGVPGHTNYHLLTEVLKNDWGFNGFTVSDWEDFIMLETVHSVAKTNEDAVVMAFNAGVDMSMVPTSPNYKAYCDLMLTAVKNGRISEDRLNDAVRRILRVKLSLGLFDKDMNQAKSYPLFGSTEFKLAALKSAEESITLLKNEAQLLPLAKSKKILVAGPTANNMIYLNGAWTHTWQGYDSSYNTKNVATIYSVIEQKIGKENCLYSQGAELFFDNGFEESRLTDVIDFKTKANLSDVILLCLGELPQTEKPGDIRSLNLSTAQLELAEIAYSTNKPVILVLTEARPRIIHSIVDSASAIVQCYLPGDFGGMALANILFGDANPSGKLPYTYPKYDGVIEFYDHPKSVDRSKNNDFKAFDPEWEFGFGLSYTTFEYADLTVDKSTISDQEELHVSVNVKNTGKIKGQEVVQLFVSDKVSFIVPAGKRLKGFEKITLEPNETKRVDFTISKEDLMFADQNGKWMLEPGTFSIEIGSLETTFELK
jgi:beta-glucosidase